MKSTIAPVITPSDHPKVVSAVLETKLIDKEVEHLAQLEEVIEAQFDDHVEVKVEEEVKAEMIVVGVDASIDTVNAAQFDEKNAILSAIGKDEILRWADSFKAEQGRFPRATDIKAADVEGAGALSWTVSWADVHELLSKGKTGDGEKITLRQFLVRHRELKSLSQEDAPQKKRESSISHAGLIRWIDEHKERTGLFPDSRAGKIKDTPFGWRTISAALAAGEEEWMCGGLVQFIFENYGVVGNKVVVQR